MGSHTGPVYIFREYTHLLKNNIEHLVCFHTCTLLCPWLQLYLIRCLWQLWLRSINVQKLGNTLQVKYMTKLPVATASLLTISYSLLTYFIMAVAVSSAVSACCRSFSSRICGSSSLTTPLVQFSTLSCTGRTLPTIARVPLRCPRAFYYVKPKEKKGPSLRSWILFGAGCVGFVSGAVIYHGKGFCNRLLLY